MNRTEVFSVAYIHNYYGLRDNIKFIKLEDYEKLKRKLELSDTKGAEYIDETLDLRKENEILKKKIRRYEEMLSSMFAAGHMVIQDEKKFKQMQEEEVQR